MRFHPLRMGEWTEALVSVKGTWFIYLLLEFRLSLKYSLRHRDYHFQKVVHPSHFSCAWFFVTLWTAAHQAVLSMGFSRQEYWSGLPCPPPGDLPHPRTEPESPALAGRFFTTSATWEAYISWCQGLFQLLLLSLSFLMVSQDKIIVYVLTLRQKTQKISQEQGSVLLTYWSSFSELYILVWGLSLT